MMITEAKWVPVGRRWKFVLEGAGLELGQADASRVRRRDWHIQWAQRHGVGKWFTMQTEGGAGPAVFEFIPHDEAIERCSKLKRRGMWKYRMVPV